jgi:hypothetical protein
MKYRFHMWAFYTFLVFLVLFLIGLAILSAGAEEAIVLMTVAGIFCFGFGIAHLVTVGLKKSIELEDSHISLNKLTGKKEIQLSEIKRISSITKFTHHTQRSGVKNTTISKKIKLLADNKTLLSLDAEGVKGKYEFYPNLKKLAAKHKIPVETSMKDSAGVRLSLVSLDLSGLFAGNLKDKMEDGLKEKDPYMIALKKALESGSISKTSWIILMRTYSWQTKHIDDPGLKKQKIKQLAEYYFS